MSEKTKVLLTGITGFVGSHTAIQLLNKGYHVLGTLRDMNRVDNIKSVIAQHTGNIDNLEFSVADLLDTEVWNSLTKNIDYIHHIASPFPAQLPENEEDIIKPAKEGALNILRAAVKNNVKRVIMTSSTTAMIYGKTQGNQNQVFNESDWTDVELKEDSTSYHRSKTIAEKAAWDFMKKSKTSTELTTVCPGLIYGPVLEEDFGTSAGIILGFLSGKTSATPNLGYDSVDVRSVADMHILAMESEKAAGERFICANGFIDFKEIIALLQTKYPEKSINTQILVDDLFREYAKTNAAMQRLLVDVGTQRKVDNSKAKELLNWKPIDVKKSILSCAESLINKGLLN